MLTSTSGHPMTTAAGLEANTLADGLFHVATWICVAAGSTLLYTAWRAGRLAPPRTRARRAAPHRLGPIQPDRRTDRTTNCSAFIPCAMTSAARSDGTSPSSPSAPPYCSAGGRSPVASACGRRRWAPANAPANHRGRRRSCRPPRRSMPRIELGAGVALEFGAGVSLGAALTAWKWAATRSLPASLRREWKNAAGDWEMRRPSSPERPGKDRKLRRFAFDGQGP